MEKIKLLLCCTKQPLYLVRNECDGYFYTMDKGALNDYKNVKTYNGKIIAECDFEVEHLYNAYNPYRESVIHYFDTDTLNEKELIKRSCLSNLKLENYFKGKNGYAIHIKNLHIFDRAKRLGECYLFKGKYYDFDSDGFGEMMNHYESLDKAPQNMCRVWVCENGEWVMYILISVRPEWLCLELNGEKTIEVRKKVLKEML